MSCTYSLDVDARRGCLAPRTLDAISLAEVDIEIDLLSRRSSAFVRFETKQASLIATYLQMLMGGNGSFYARQDRHDLCAKIGQPEQLSLPAIMSAIVWRSSAESVLGELEDYAGYAFVPSRKSNWQIFNGWRSFEVLIP